MADFLVGDRVWWWHTQEYVMRGTVREPADTTTTVGVQPDDGTGLLYLDPGQLHPAVPTEDGVYSGISEVDYHHDTASLSSSGARALLPPSCPAIFRHEQDQPPNPKPEYDFGSAAHKFVLGEGAQVVEVQFDSWRTKESQALRNQAWQQECVPLLTKDVVKARWMAEEVLRHPIARALFEADGKAELSGYWHDPVTGVRLRFRPDWLCDIGGRIICVDYKTSTSAHPGHFARVAAEWGYHQQQAWYFDGLAATGIADDAEFLFAVQSKTPPFPVSVIRINPEHVDVGRSRNRAAIDLYQRCITTGEWPGFGELIHTVDLPAYRIYQQGQELSA